MNTSYDIAVIGQGIAGSLMAWFLKKEGKKVIIVDNNFNRSSSVVAAGIVNPVTGKNYVSSWRIHEFLPFAMDTYNAINAHYHIHCYTYANIIRSLYTVLDENTWLARSSDPQVAAYFCKSPDLAEYDGKVERRFGYGELTGTFYVNMQLIMHTIKKDWVSHDDYIIENFDYNQLTYSDQLFHYRNRSFKEVVFCEGYKGLYNPFFSGIRLAPSKGEVLIVKIPGADFSKMYKDGIFIIPQGNDTYWVGSGYEWNAEDCTPTIKNYEFLSSELKRVLKIPFEIVEHKAAIRPTMHNRRPTLMVNDQYPGMYCFNGLGTKGASIAPFAAHQFTRYIVYKNPQDFIL